MLQVTSAFHILLLCLMVKFIRNHLTQPKSPRQSKTTIWVIGSFYHLLLVECQDSQNSWPENGYLRAIATVIPDSNFLLALFPRSGLTVYSGFFLKLLFLFLPNKWYPNGTQMVTYSTHLALSLQQKQVKLSKGANKFLLLIKVYLLRIKRKKIPLKNY